MSGETVLVTGATRGIGREIVRLLLRLGHDVIGVYRRDRDSADALLREHPERLRLLQTELGDADALEVLAETIAQDHGVLAAAVLCAGTTAHGELAADDGSRVLAAQLHENLFAPLALVGVLVRAEALIGPAAVVIVGSNLARRGLAGRAAYSAA
ncbi:MAG: SDR family NAD(P)-dependent oxidoreductase, partial [Deltaproteobacteria bacterium]|nr:SDR family NAD(P)-dependent oxidoreductase [Nannocystaceae bacterium]